MIKHIYTTRDGKKVNVTTVALKHMEAHKMPTRLLQRVIYNTSTGNKKLVLETVKMGDFIGKSGGIELPTVDTDTVVKWAKRKGRNTYTRVTTDHVPVECGTVAVILKLDEVTGEYELVTAYIGEIVTIEPFGVNTEPYQVKFCWDTKWNSFAIVYNTDEFQPNTMTSASFNQMVEAQKYT